MSTATFEIKDFGRKSQRLWSTGSTPLYHQAQAEWQEVIQAILTSRSSSGYLFPGRTLLIHRRCVYPVKQLYLSLLTSSGGMECIQGPRAMGHLIPTIQRGRYRLYVPCICLRRRCLSKLLVVPLLTAHRESLVIACCDMSELDVLTYFIGPIILMSLSSFCFSKLHGFMTDSFPKSARRCAKCLQPSRIPPRQPRDLFLVVVPHCPGSCRKVQPAQVCLHFL